MQYSIHQNSVPNATDSLRFVICGSALILCICFARDLTAQEEKEELKPPPAPKFFQELIERGKTKFEFYKFRRSDQKFTGETHFKFDVLFDFKYRALRRSGARSRKQIFLVSYSNVKLKIENLIRVPRSYVDEDFWESKLVKHEFEHVRINADPRIEMIVSYLVKKNRRVEVQIPSGEQMSEKLIKDEITKKITDISAEVLKLVQNNGVLLDDLTKHGQRPLKDPNFFDRLYMEDNLKEQEFASLAGVQNLLKSEKYKKLSKNEK